MKTKLKTSRNLVDTHESFLTQVVIFLKKTSRERLKWESVRTTNLFGWPVFVSLKWICIMCPCQFLHFSGRRSGLVTVSLYSCDQPEKTGWGKLMCNTLFCPYGYCQGATEQGTYCVSRSSRHSYMSMFKATGVCLWKYTAGLHSEKPSLDK